MTQQHADQLAVLVASKTLLPALARLRLEQHRAGAQCQLRGGSAALVDAALREQIDQLRVVYAYYSPARFSYRVDIGNDTHQEFSSASALAMGMLRLRRTRERLAHTKQMLNGRDFVRIIGADAAGACVLVTPPSSRTGPRKSAATAAVVPVAGEKSSSTSSVSRSPVRTKQQQQRTSADAPSTARKRSLRNLSAVSNGDSDDDDDVARALVSMPPPTTADWGNADTRPARHAAPPLITEVINSAPQSHSSAGVLAAGRGGRRAPSKRVGSERPESPPPPPSGSQQDAADATVDPTPPPPPPPQPFGSQQDAADAIVNRAASARPSLCDLERRLATVAADARVEIERIEAAVAVRDEALVRKRRRRAEVVAELAALLAEMEKDRCDFDEAHRFLQTMEEDAE